MSGIEFGKPNLRAVSLVRKYELEGVAFVEGYDKAVGFTFHSGHLGNLSLIIDNEYQAREVYRFFKNTFKDFTSKESGLSKSLLGLSVDWKVADGKKEEALSQIEKVMDSDWKDAFRTILSVYEK